MGSLDIFEEKRQLVQNTFCRSTRVQKSVPRQKETLIKFHEFLRADKILNQSSSVSFAYSSTPSVFHFPSS